LSGTNTLAYRKNRKLWTKKFIRLRHGDGEPLVKHVQAPEKDRSRMEEFEKRRGFDDVNVGLGVCVGRRRVGIGF
jgi:hypothetical protein